MQPKTVKRYCSHGTGEFRPEQFARLGPDVVFEPGVLVFHPETIEIGGNVYVGHRAMLKGYHAGRIVIGDDTWIGQGCFLHGAGGLTIGRAVGIGPMVNILTSQHRGDDLERPVLFTALEFGAVVIGDGGDIGTGSTILPGVTIGQGAIIGAGSLVNRDVPDYEIWAGVPARRLRSRREPG